MPAARKKIDALCTVHYTVPEVSSMRFTGLIAQLSRENSLEIIHSTDLFEISDVALIDGSQAEYTNTVLYFGYVEQLSFTHLPAQCILARSPTSEALTGAAGDLALAAPEALFRLVNAAKRMQG